MIQQSCTCFQIGNKANWWQIVRELEAAEPMQAVGDGISRRVFCGGK